METGKVLKDEVGIECCGLPELRGLPVAGTEGERSTLNFKATGGR